MDSAPGEAGRTRALPHTTINELAGLLEHLHEAPLHRADIYQLAKDLKVELNSLLPLTEAAEVAWALPRLPRGTSHSPHRGNLR